MTDLTDKWKKGELPEGRYWVKCKKWAEEIEMLEYSLGTFLDVDVPLENDQIIEILAPVPSYDEYIKLIEDNKRLKHDVGNLGYKIKNQRKEIEKQIEQNAQLKELLKECRDYLPYGGQICLVSEATRRLSHLKSKIDEVLK